MGVLKELSISNNFDVSRGALDDCYKPKEKQCHLNKRAKLLAKRQERHMTESENHHPSTLTSLGCIHDGVTHHESDVKSTSSRGSNDVELPCDVYDSNLENSDCYYDASLAQKCHKLLHQSGKASSSRILLFPEEEWARNAPGIQWSIKINRWWKRYCTVTEIRAGGRQSISAVGKIVQNRDGTLTILGRFKRNEYPDFRLHLTARVTKDDFEHGYVMTGALQLGDLKGQGSMEITHFAVMPRYQGKEE
ncbi:uncharacterized protein LOC143471004 [Clavelina lepadiformis]|uniref:uncharacterized protein LOC143471004 n=1 Tax=Clavelina lepadiformis TaxID=159417 RepID=UPI004042E94E